MMHLKSVLGLVPFLISTFLATALPIANDSIQSLTCGECDDFYRGCMYNCPQKTHGQLSWWPNCHPACFCKIAQYEGCTDTCGFDEAPCPAQREITTEAMKKIPARIDEFAARMENYEVALLGLHRRDTENNVKDAIVDSDLAKRIPAPSPQIDFEACKPCIAYVQKDCGQVSKYALRAPHCLGTNQLLDMRDRRGSPLLERMHLRGRCQRRQLRHSMLP
jgi:hypothetical protein